MKKVSFLWITPVGGLLWLTGQWQPLTPSRPRLSLWPRYAWHRPGHQPEPATGRYPDPPLKAASDQPGELPRGCWNAQDAEEVIIRKSQEKLALFC